ncbi:MAG: ubiquinone biosynthesis protein [Pseudomonadota bacterium]
MTIWQILGSFPSIIPTVLLGVLLVYWLLSIIGLVDLGDALHGDGYHSDVGDVAHVDGHQHDGDFHSLAGYMVALGLGGVPLSIAATVLVFFTWLATALAHQYLIVNLPTEPVRLVAGIATLLFAMALSIPLSARVIKPMRGLFVKHSARNNASLVGMECKILTKSVDQGFGRAEVKDHGANFNIKVWARSPNDLTRNSSAIILDYDEATQQYEVQAAPAGI